MRTLVAILADAAIAHPDGKLYMLGAGIEIIKPPACPYVHPALSLACKIEFTVAESGRPWTIEVHPIDQDGQPFGATTSLQVTPQRNPEHGHLPVSVQFVLNMQGIAFTRAGSNSFSVLVGGHEVASVPLHILEPPSAQ